MTLQELCEPLLLYVCRLNRSFRKDAKIDYRQTRAEIESQFNDMSAKAASDPGLASQYGKVKLALIAFVDSMIAESALPFKKEWHGHRLGFELPKLGWAAQPEMDLDQKFFEILEETLADKTEGANERLAVLYNCLGLGFTGWYSGQPEYLKSKMLECAARLRKDMDSEETTRLCPQAYEYTDRRAPFAPVGTKIGAIAIALVGLILLLGAINVYLYNTNSAEMEDALNAITALPDPQ